MRFFYYMYYNIYFVSNRNNSSPEIVTVSNISFCQTNNILTLLNLFFFFSKINKDYNIPKYYLIIQIILILVNYYYFVTKKKGVEIMKEKKFSLGNFKFFNIFLLNSFCISNRIYILYLQRILVVLIKKKSFYLSRHSSPSPKLSPYLVFMFYKTLYKRRNNS